MPRLVQAVRARKADDRDLDNRRPPPTATTTTQVSTNNVDNCTPRRAGTSVQLPAGLQLPAVLHAAAAAHDLPRAVRQVVRVDPGMVPCAPRVEALAGGRAGHGPVLQPAHREAAGDGRCA